MLVHPLRWRFHQRLRNSNKLGQLGNGTNLNQLLDKVRLNGNVARFVGVGPSAKSVFFVREEKHTSGAELNNQGQL